MTFSNGIWVDSLARSAPRYRRPLAPFLLSHFPHERHTFGQAHRAIQVEEWTRARRLQLGRASGGHSRGWNRLRALLAVFPQLLSVGAGTRGSFRRRRATQ